MTEKYTIPDGEPVDMSEVTLGERYEAGFSTPLSGRCPVCWRSHGCSLTEGHEGSHRCCFDAEADCWDEPRPGDRMFDYRDFHTALPGPWTAEQIADYEQWVEATTQERYDNWTAYWPGAAAGIEGMKP